MKIALASPAFPASLEIALSQAATLIQVPARLSQYSAAHGHVYAG